VRFALALLALAACRATPDLAYDADSGRADSDAGVTDAGGADSSTPSDAAPVGDASGSAARKKAITIDPTKVPDALTDFPVWVDLADPEIAARAQTDGRDLFFTATDGAPLAHEIRGWDPAKAHLTAWVRVPQVSSTAPTVIYLRYGDATGAPAPAPSAVFSSSFVAVWHLDDALADPAIADATGAHAGTGVGLTSAQQVAAQLGGGVAFTGGNDEITFTNPLTGNGPHTISVWVSQRTTADNDALVVLGNGACGQSRWLHSRFNAATIAVGFYCNDWANPNVDVQNAGWTLLHWVFEGANDTSRLYKNGALVAGPFTHSGTAIDSQGTGGHLGNAPAAWGPNMGAHATMDEARIATVARSPAWIGAEYANQSSPSTFYAVGPEEPAP
jgi:hypothetical protein